MSISLSPHPRSVIVTKLRAAGCVFAEDEARLLISAARTRSDLAAMVDRRAAGLPLEHVLGWAECCGSGAVGAALVAALDRAKLYVVDIDHAAVRCARHNLAAGSQVYGGDLYEPLPATLRGRVDILVANRTLRTHRGDRAAAPGSPHTRAAGGAGRWRGWA